MICQKCGAEITADATVCLTCGCPLVENAVPTEAQTKKSNKKRNIFIILGAILLVLAILAVMILPHPNMELDDFSDVGTIGALFQYGIPSDTQDDCWGYFDSIEFYGIPVERFEYDMQESSWFLSFSPDCREDVSDILDEHCELEDTVVFTVYSYGDLEITDHGSFLMIEFN